MKRTTPFSGRARHRHSIGQRYRGLRIEGLERRDLLAVVEFQFTARVDSVSDPGAVLQGAVVVGGTIAGRFSYNTALADGNADPASGSYVGGGPDNKADGSLGPLVFRSDDTIGGGNSIFMSVLNGASDSLFYTATGDTTPSLTAVPGIDFIEAQLNLSDAQGTSFSNDGLPADLVLADFEDRSLTLFAEDNAGTRNPFVIDATITALTKIDDPDPPPTDAEKALFLDRVFDDLFGRDPTAAETAALLNRVGNDSARATLVHEFLDSDEYRDDLVGSMYSLLLNRTPDPAGAEFWAGRLAAGIPDEVVLSAIAASQEYMNAAGSDADAFVDALYLDLLGREADSSGASFWVARLQDGVGRQQVALGFATSTEFVGLLVDDPADLLLGIGGWYQDYLGRNAEDDARSFWIGQIVNGWATVQAGLLSTDEYLVRSDGSVIDF